jgi:hypothetical protein
MLNYFVDFVDTTGEERLSIYQFSGKPGVMDSLGSDMMQLFNDEGYKVRKFVCVQGIFLKREIDEMVRRWNTPDFPSSAKVLYLKR